MELALDLLQGLRKSTAATGLDLGSRNVKCVRLTQKGKALLLDRMFLLDLAENNSDYPVNPHTTQRLAAAIQTHSFQRNERRVLAAGSNAHVQCLDLNLPKMPKKELQLVIANNLEEQSGRSLNQLSYDYQEITQQDSHLVRVYYSDLRHVNATLDTLIAADLKPLKLNASFLALNEMLEFNEYTNPEKAYILVDIGESSTSTALILDHEILAAHSQPTALVAVSQTIMAQQDCQYAAAEALKFEYLRGQSNFPKELDTAIDDAYKEICESIQRTIDYFREQDLGTPISEILLTGGGASFNTIALVLEAHNKLKTTVVNPFRNIQTLHLQDQFTPDQILALAPLMGVAVGLALGGID